MNLPTMATLSSKNQKNRHLYKVASLKCRELLKNSYIISNSQWYYRNLFIYAFSFIINQIDQLKTADLKGSSSQRDPNIKNSDIYNLFESFQFPWRPWHDKVVQQLYSSNNFINRDQSHASDGEKICSYSHQADQNIKFLQQIINKLKGKDHQLAQPLYFIKQQQIQQHQSSKIQTQNQHQNPNSPQQPQTYDTIRQYQNSIQICQNYPKNPFLILTFYQISYVHNNQIKNKQNSKTQKPLIVFIVRNFDGQILELHWLSNQDDIKSNKLKCISDVCKKRKMFMFIVDFGVVVGDVDLDGVKEKIWQKEMLLTKDQTQNYHRSKRQIDFVYFNHRNHIFKEKQQKQQMLDEKKDEKDKKCHQFACLKGNLQQCKQILRYVSDLVSEEKDVLFQAQNQQKYTSLILNCIDNKELIFKILQLNYERNPKYPETTFQQFLEKQILIHQNQMKNLQADQHCGRHYPATISHSKSKICVNCHIQNPESSKSTIYKCIGCSIQNGEEFPLCITGCFKEFHVNQQKERKQKNQDKEKCLKNLNRIRNKNHYKNINQLKEKKKLADKNSKKTNQKQMQQQQQAFQIKQKYQQNLPSLRLNLRSSSSMNKTKIISKKSNKNSESQNQDSNPATPNHSVPSSNLKMSETIVKQQNSPQYLFTPRKDPFDSNNNTQFLARIMKLKRLQANLFTSVDSMQRDVQNTDSIQDDNTNSSSASSALNQAKQETLQVVRKIPRQMLQFGVKIAQLRNLWQQQSQQNHLSQSYNYQQSMKQQEDD